MISDFIKTQEWKEMKEIMLSHLKDDINDIKTEGMAPESIAVEVRAMAMANKKLKKAILSVERKGMIAKVKDESWK